MNIITLQPKFHVRFHHQNLLDVNIRTVESKDGADVIDDSVNSSAASPACV